MGSSKRSFYHYTTADSADKIDESKLIKGSTKKVCDAFYGDGVYLTDKKAEDYTKTQIAKNNYGKGDDSYKKLEKYVEVRLPKNEVEKCDTGGGRQVYLYRGNLNLNKYDHSINNANFKRKKKPFFHLVFRQLICNILSFFIRMFRFSRKLKILMKRF